MEAARQLFYESVRLCISELSLSSHSSPSDGFATLTAFTSLEPACSCKGCLSIQLFGRRLLNSKVGYHRGSAKALGNYTLDTCVPFDKPKVASKTKLPIC